MAKCWLPRPAAASFGDDDLLVGELEVVDKLAGLLIVKGCADRNLENDGVAVQAGAVGAHPVLAALALVLGIVAEVDEGVVAQGRGHEDVAAVAAVAAGGSAAGDKLLPAEGHAAVAAVAAFDANSCFIDKHEGPGIRNQRSGIKPPALAGEAKSEMPSFQFTESGIESLASPLLGVGGGSTPRLLC